jgi:histone H3/H4
LARYDPLLATEDRLPEATPWRRCSACKKPIALGALYWTCNVSTCNQKRTALCFCNVSCWEVHLPGANHREAWAVEKRAPKTPDAGAESALAGGGGVRRLVRSTAPPPPAPALEEVLIVASRLKDYVRARSGYNTSDRVLEPLSEIVRRILDQAIENARRDGRMTVLDRDIPES